MSEEENTRMVSFRLKVDQYAKLEELRPLEGSRSISDLFRRAVDKLIEDLTAVPAPKDAFSARIRKLERRVDLLAADLKKLQT